MELSDRLRRLSENLSADLIHKVPLEMQVKREFHGPNGFVLKAKGGGAKLKVTVEYENN